MYNNLKIKEMCSMSRKVFCVCCCNDYIAAPCILRILEKMHNTR